LILASRASGSFIPIFVLSFYPSLSVGSVPLLRWHSSPEAMNDFLCRRSLWACLYHLFDNCSL